MGANVRPTPPDAAQRSATAGADRLPTSVILETLIRQAPASHVTLSWLIEHLHARSFGILLLIIAVVGLMPGASSLMGVLIAIPAVQMLLGRAAPALPPLIARRPLSTRKLVRVLERLIPLLARMERVVRPRWRTPFEATKRVVGFVILLLGVTLLVPLPFSHIVPVLVIMLMAFAFIEEDGVLLSVSLVAAVLSLAISVASVWGTLAAGRLL